MARDQPIELKKELTSKALVTLNVVETMLKNQGTKFAAGGKEIIKIKLFSKSFL